MTGSRIVTNRPNRCAPVWINALLCLAILLVTIPFKARALAANLSCPVENQIIETFDSGATWQMCWGNRKRENIVLSEISFQAPGSEPISVLSSLRLAQLHVAYDDSNVTYNDITQFGLGAGYVTTLDADDCPGGQLINLDGRPGLCRMSSVGDDAFRTATETRLAESLTLFSVSQVGSYAYIVTWKFFSDGSIQPSVGAAGALQRSSDWAESPFGRELEGVAEKSWLSHTHNYYWQMDFDIGDDANDDKISEVSYRLDREGRRHREVKTLTTESARRIAPDTMLSWYVTSGSQSIDRAPGYIIEPLHYGHKLVRTVTEPFTDYDFFITKQSDCERFVSENAKYNPDCDENILQFVNDESLVGEDIVAWHRISFHHVPRNEDRQNMHSHWDGFLIRARNLSAFTPGHSGNTSNSAPILQSPGNQHYARGEVVSLSLSVEDADGDTLAFTATGLPDGISLNAAGELTGAATENGVYSVTINVSDSLSTATASFDWRVSQRGPSSGGSSSVGAVLLMFILMTLFVRRWTRGSKTYS